MICAYNSGAEVGTLPLPVLSGWPVIRPKCFWDREETLGEVIDCPALSSPVHSISVVVWDGRNRFHVRRPQPDLPGSVHAKNVLPKSPHKRKVHCDCGT
jgi:hypothetical protein